MLDTTNIKVNAVSGTIVKNYAKSFFVRFQLGSMRSDSLLDTEARINGRSAVVIQVMCAGGHNEMIAEVMYKNDFDEMMEDSQKGWC